MIVSCVNFMIILLVDLMHRSLQGMKEQSTMLNLQRNVSYISISHFPVIIIIERKDLGGVMSKDCKDTLQTLKTVTKRECDAK